MSVLKFEVYLNDTFLFDANSVEELRSADEKVGEYLKEHPEIDEGNAKVHINIKREPCRGCK